MVEQLSPIAAHEQTIARIFSDDYTFEIPPYQRPYAWEEPQASELLNDLIDAMDAPASTGGVYFLGSIVLIKSPKESLSRVVDGQQRLTTLTILLSVLRDLTSDSESQYERRQYIYQKASADKGTHDSYRLLLRKSDRPFFQKIIQDTGATSKLPSSEKLEGSKKRIAENAAFFRSELGVRDEAFRNRLVAFIIQRCYLVVVAVPTAETARRIFTVLNARGMDLLPTDILKADLLERVSETRESSLAERWEAIETVLGRDNFVELFGHIRMMFKRDKPREALETAFPKQVPSFNGKAEAFFAETLEPISDAWILLTRPAEFRAQFGEEALRALQSLNRIDNKDWLPPILLRLWKRKTGEDDTVARFVVDLERLAYFLFVTRADINTRILRFAGVMDQIEPPIEGTVRAEGVALSTAEVGEFSEALNGPLYRYSRICKPILQRLDEALSAGGATYDNLVSIEHVLPQTVDADSEWASLYPNEDVRGRWTHRLANLVFLTKRINTKASNWDFERKKKEYFESRDGTSPFPLTQGVLQADQWTIEHLEDRQGKLLAALCKVWRLAPLATSVEA